MTSLASFPFLMLSGIVWFCATTAVGILLDFPRMDETRRWLARPGMKLLGLVAGLSPALVLITHLQARLLTALGAGSASHETVGFWVSAPLMAGLAGSWLALPRGETPRAEVSRANGISFLIWMSNLGLAALWA